MSIMECKACKARGKTWSGDDPVCAFRKDGVFSQDNWNCATVGKIRDLCERAKVYCDDDWYCLLHTHGVFDDSRLALWVQWYKQRGRTQDMYILFGDESQPRPPTLEECEMVIARLSQTEGAGDA